MTPTILIADSSVLSDEALYNRLYEALPFERRVNTDKFRYQKDKCNSVAVWTLLQLALQRNGYDPKGITLEKNEFGKPFLKDLSGFQFNFSHSGERAVCAVWDGDIGCDVELIRPQNLMIAQRFFADSEKERLESFQDEEMKSREFCRIWTLKESFLKCVGTGLYRSPESFSICFEDERPLYTEGGFSFFEYFKDPDYRLSCCIKGEAPDAVFEITDLKKQIC